MAEALPPEKATLFALVARELATEAYTLEALCRRYDISEDYYRTEIEPNPFYQKVYATYVAEWQSLGSTHKRIAFAAAAALEEKMPVLADRMGSRSTDLADAVAAAKMFRELAGIAPPAPSTAAGSGERFQIQINIGNDRVQLEAKPVLELEDNREPQSAGTKNSTV